MKETIDKLREELRLKEITMGYYRGKIESLEFAITSMTKKECKCEKE